jgi:hypothetical protein
MPLATSRPTNFDDLSLSKFDNAGRLRAARFASGFNSNPESCAVDRDGNVYVCQRWSSEISFSGLLNFSSSGTLLARMSPSIGLSVPTPASTPSHVE